MPLPLYTLMSKIEHGFWIFGYGSLLWKPGFEVERSIGATLEGYRRGFCLWSVHYRGTEESPGLVLGLDQENGAKTRGMALRVAPEIAEQTYQYIRDRELISYAYVELWTKITLADGTQAEALTYVMDPHNVQYCPPMSLTEQADVIARAEGSSGPNADYLFETNKRLAALGQSDPDLTELERMVRGIRVG